MNLRGIRWPRLLLSALGTFAALGFLSLAVQRQSVEKPLEEALRAHPEVQEVDLQRQGAVAVIRVRLGRVGNLRAAYEALEATARGVRALGPFRLELRDARDPALEDVYYRLHFSIAEANATGAFGKMAREVEAVTRGSGVEPRVYVGAERIYVALYRGDRYLYEVLPRPQPAPRAAEGA